MTTPKNKTDQELLELLEKKRKQAIEIHMTIVEILHEQRDRAAKRWKGEK